MHTERYSYIKSILGEERYEEFRGYAKRFVPIATIVLVTVLMLTYFFHWVGLAVILNRITGGSLIFVTYILGVVLLLDYGVAVPPDETEDSSNKVPETKPMGYILSIAWEIVLIIFAVAAIYISHLYRMHYDFECDTFLVDENNGIYHLKYRDDEEDMEYTTMMEGYEIEELGYTFCEDCQEWEKELEMEAE